MGVVAKIFNDLLWTKEGRLGVNNPILFGGFNEKGFEDFGVFVFFATAWKDQFGVSLFKIVQELTAKDLRQDFFGQEIILRRRHPALAIKAYAPAGHDKMDVGMIRKSLPPRVKDRSEAEVGFKAPGADLFECFRYGAKQYAKRNPFIAPE